MKLKIKHLSEVFSYEGIEEVVSIGRSSANDFVIPLSDISRKHCLITFKGPYIFIMDLGSKNGVTIDGKRIAPNEQHTIYENSQVFIANNFELVLPDVTTAVSQDLPTSEPLVLEKILVRRHK